MTIWTNKDDDYRVSFVWPKIVWEFDEDQGDFIYSEANSGFYWDRSKYETKLVLMFLGFGFVFVKSKFPEIRN